MPRLIETAEVVADPERNWISDDAAGERPFAPDTVDPDNINEHVVSDDGELPTVSEAVDTFLRFNKSIMNDKPDNMARAEYARYNQFPRICDSDRKFQHEYDLTTATITRRLSPLDENDELLTPWEMSEQMHGGDVQSAIRSALSYQFEEFDWEWCAVTTPREGSGAPQEHIHLWIDDSQNEVTTGFLETAREKHLEYVPNAYEEDHQGGCIQVATDPETTDTLTKEAAAAIITHSDYPATYPTKSAYYVATNLPELIVYNYYDEDRPTPPRSLQEGAAASWLTPHRWFRTSSGMLPAEQFAGGGK